MTDIPDTDHRALENDDFEPEVDAIWLRQTLQIINELKSSTGTIEANGDMVYDLFAPTGTGVSPVRTIARALADTFEEGQSLQYNGLEVILEQTERFPGAQDFGEDGVPSLWYQIPVIISWRVFTPSSV